MRGGDEAANGACEQVGEQGGEKSHGHGDADRVGEDAAREGADGGEGLGRVLLGQDGPGQAFDLQGGGGAQNGDAAVVVADSQEFFPAEGGFGGPGLDRQVEDDGAELGDAIDPELGSPVVRSSRRNSSRSWIMKRDWSRMRWSWPVR